MTETSPNPTLQSIATSRYDSATAKAALHDRLRAEAAPRNKAAIFDALEKASIRQVIVSFDGFADSGQIEEIQVNEEPGAQLPAMEVEYEDAKWGDAAPTKLSCSLRAAIENLTYHHLYETHCGWQDGAGAFGEFTFDTATRKITLAYNERITDTDYSEHEF